MIPESLHFLRPAWLLALPLLGPVLWSMRRLGGAAAAWRRACDPHLLTHLVGGRDEPAARWPLALVAAGWISACLALAGPTWERLPQPAFKEPTQTVLVLDLSPSMDATDLAPSRLARARYELLGALERIEGSVGLVIFAEEPYTVAPITDDPKVIHEMVPVLSTDLMPGRGTFVGRAVDEASALLERAGATRGRIVLLADDLGQDADEAHEAARRAASAGHPVSVLGFGPDATSLASLASEGGGHFVEVTADDQDWDLLLASGFVTPALSDLERAGLKADVWRDMGAWLVLIPLVLAPLAFRRGWATAFAVAVLLNLPAGNAQADGLADLWRRPDQQGAAAFAEGRHAEAAELFEDPAWRGAASYRSGDYPSAAEALAALDDSRSRYNLGNALAHEGRLEEAIAAYDEALEREPDNEDALHNRELVKQLLQQQQSQPRSGQDSHAGEEGQQSESGPQESGTQQAEAGEQSEGGGQSESDEQSQSGGESRAGEQSQTGEQSQPGQASQDGSETQRPPAEESADEASRSSDAEAESSQHAAGSHSDPSESSAAREPQAPQPAEAADAELQRSELDALAGRDPRQGVEGDRSAAAPAGTPRDITEHEQAVEQWLKRIPDDPGGLLREKLRRRYAERRFEMGRSR